MLYWAFSEVTFDRDITIMQRAGFKVVRMSDISWGSCEPAGQVRPRLVHKIMDKMQAAGIRVILDIPGAPAPIWLHRAYPGVVAVAQNGMHRVAKAWLPRRPTILAP